MKKHLEKRTWHDFHDMDFLVNLGRFMLKLIVPKWRAYGMRCVCVCVSHESGYVPLLLFTRILERIVLITVSMPTHTHTRAPNGPYELASHRAIRKPLFAQSVLAAAEGASLISKLVPLLVSYWSCCLLSSGLLKFRALPPTRHWCACTRKYDCNV